MSKPLKAKIKKVELVYEPAGQPHIQIDVEFNKGMQSKKYIVAAPNEIEDAMQRIENDRQRLEDMEKEFVVLKAKEGTEI